MDPQNTRVITVAELSEHNSAESCWMAIHGIVYDVTEFMSRHPGGSSILKKNCGSDQTDNFERFRHSQRARTMAKKYQIGVLQGSPPGGGLRSLALLMFS